SRGAPRRWRSRESRGGWGSRASISWLHRRVCRGLLLGSAGLRVLRLLVGLLDRAVAAGGADHRARSVAVRVAVALARREAHDREIGAIAAGARRGGR